MRLWIIVDRFVCDQRKKNKQRKNKEIRKKECQIQESWCRRLLNPKVEHDDSSMTTEVNQKWSEERPTGSRTRKENRSVTGFGSKRVCFPSAHLRLGGDLCPLHCFLEIRHFQICPIFASEIQYGRFLREKNSDHSVKVCVTLPGY